jgi:TldD protein
MKLFRLLIFFGLIFYASFMQAQEKLTKILNSELKRNFEELKRQENPPYYISLRVNDKTSYNIKALYGDISANEQKRERILQTSLRIGSHEFDNTREIRDDYNQWFDYPETINISLEDSEQSIRTTIWRSIDDAYRAGINKYNQVKANVAVKVDGEDESDDFSKEETFVSYEKPINPEFNPDEWIQRLKQYSAVFLNFPEIYDAEAGLTFTVERRSFVCTDGSEIEENSTAARLFISIKVKADDGMELPLFQSYFAFLPQDLPDSEIILKDAQEMAELLVQLRTAPVAESYAGPAILSGDAAGVFFHEIFGHRIEGHRLKLSTDGQTFKNKVGESVLPEHLSVIFDPQMKQYNSEDLYGHYKYDDQGIKGQKVVVVDNGILNDFLMSRTPIENFSSSNGHGRAYAGREVVSRQSNMIIKTSKPLSIQELRASLKNELKEQNKEYGFFFKTVRGGFTTTGRFMPNSFNVSPLVVYRVYADEREDELIRGVDLIGTPLAMFSQIIEAADDYGIFHGTCGAESGWVPVSAISPSLLVKQIETQKNVKSQDRPFILPAPETKNQQK